MAKAPGKAYRKGITLKQIMQMFPDNATAERWFVEQRWHGVIACPSCGSVNVQTGCQHKTMPYRCREKECAQKFSVKTGTVMEYAKVGYQDWLLAAFLLMTSLKSVSSMKLHRDLGLTQKTAWFLAQRLRVALSQDAKLFTGPGRSGRNLLRRSPAEHAQRHAEGAGWHWARPRRQNGRGGHQGPRHEAGRCAGRDRHETRPRSKGSWVSMPRLARRSTPTTRPPMSRCRSIMPR